MKITKSLTYVGISALLMLNSAAFAQNGNGAGGGAMSGNAMSGQTDTTGNREQRNDDTDYGWLGLLGLAGLAGLMKKPTQEVVHQTEVTRTNTGTGPTNR